MPGIASSAPAVLLAHVAGGHPAHPDRLGRRDAAQPRARWWWPSSSACSRRCTRAGSIWASGGRRAPTRSPPPPCDAAWRACRPTTSPRPWASCSASSTAGSPRAIPTARSPPSPAWATDPPCGCWARATTAPRWPACSACPSRSPTTSRRRHTLPAVAAYRSRFRPSDELDRPYVMLGVAVLCAETEERARWLAGSGALAMARLRQGRPGLYPTPEEAAEHVYSPLEKQIIGPWRESQVVGDPDQVPARPGRAGRAHRRRRADHDHHGPRLSRTGCAPTSWWPRRPGWSRRTRDRRA